MATTTENSVAARWLVGLLKADTGAGGVATLATGGIHRNRDVTRSTIYPKVIARFQGGSDLNALGAARRVYVSGLWAVYAVIRQDSIDPIDALAARIDTLLNGQKGTATGGIVLSCVRESPLELPSLEDGIGANLLGGIYRIQAQLT